ncbi:MAG: PAS domain S-box protein [Candidatus Methanoperedens sp.]|nr:PAS domain S-box protein [Candidatus Methanoperedens sp.]CAG0959852.1 two-component system, sporulation sensor kinase A [Methanosarcinales archaeon]
MIEDSRSGYEESKLKTLSDIASRDITEIKLAEEKLYNSEKYLRAIIESSLDGIAVVNHQGEIEFGNDSFFNIVGWPKDELLGQSFIKMLTKDTKELYIKIWHEAQNSLNSSKIADAKIITKKGEIRYLLNSRAEMVLDGVKKFLFITKDITKQKKIELKLEESEAKFRDLFDNADDPMYTHDLKGNFLTVNKIGIKLLGGTEEEIIGSNISKWLTPDSYRIFEDRVRKIYLNQPLEPTVVIEVINKNGEHKFGEARTRLIRDGNRIIAVHGIVRDITEKIKLEKDLKKSEEKYRDLFENAQDAMYVLDIKANILKMNRIGLQILGCSSEEVIGTNISKWITPDSQKIINERRKKRLSGEKVDQTDILEIVCKNGEHRWAEIRTREIKDGDRTIEIHGIARDITENRLLKQELKKSNKQQKLLCYLIQGTRGGKTRALILKHLGDRSYNANQLATALNLDYKTIRHHLKVLIKNGIITKNNDGYCDLYSISNNIDLDSKVIEGFSKY